ncbi:MAG: class I SAM-dependent RNA methyltransferase [Candidatus Eremiobacteraeota bacterium]|nr:class I SAM-dependent RNA methyltransferase [Candidatus Eremiobacteraeota bacterium]
MTLIATATFGVEKVVKNELKALGYDDLKGAEGRVEFQAPFDDIPKLNLWLRSSDRLLLKMGEFKALTFEELFEETRALPWEQYITERAKFTVKGKAVKSTLGSIRACQAIVKKAVVEKLKSKYHVEWFEETGAEYTIQVAMHSDIALLTIDTSGTGLHKRGYRKKWGEAPLKETLAAALVQLSYYDRERLLVDPLCGSGTILTEAALIARNIAPGLTREFASEEWPQFSVNAWSDARRSAREAIITGGELRIFGYDIDEKCIEACRINARNAGVEKDITFERKDIKDLWIDKHYGIMISNPPYGMRMADFKEINEIYITIHKMFKKKNGWSVYILTADELFPNYFKRARPDRVRKLFNGKIKVNYYQYYGERPDGETRG